jgi:hypothetical protein
LINGRYILRVAASPTTMLLACGSLNPSSQFLAYEMPLPPMKTQQRVREMKIRVDELRKRHAQQRAELEALMSSVLKQAFRGEL